MTRDFRRRRGEIREEEEVALGNLSRQDPISLSEPLAKFNHSLKNISFYIYRKRMTAKLKKHLKNASLVFFSRDVATL